MADCAMRWDQALIVGLDATEMETLKLHADREELSITSAMADLVEFALSHKACEICQEEKEARTEPSAEPDTIEFSMKWAKDGPYAVLNETDKQFVWAVMAMSLREALAVVIYKKMNKETQNVVEREDEGNGAGEHPFPVN